MIEGEPRPESPELDPSRLSFRQLEQAYALARTTFNQDGDVFRNPRNDAIGVTERIGVWKVYTNLSSDRHDLQSALVNEPHNGPIKSGSSNKDEVINAIRALLENTGNRIIE